MLEAVPPIVFQASGFVGVALYLGAYAALQTGAIRGTGYTYAILNLGASALVLVSLITDFNFWSAIIQISWIVISLVGIVRYYLISNHSSITPEERRLVSNWFANIALTDTRRLLKKGIWETTDPGAVIATEGEEIGYLYFLTDGVADVTVNGNKVGELTAPSIIGELTCFDGGPAGATVASQGQARYFRLDTAILRDLCRKRGELRPLLQSSFAHDTKAKLEAANKRMSA